MALSYDPPGYDPPGYDPMGYEPGDGGGGVLPAWDWYRHPNYASTTVEVDRDPGDASLVLADASRFVVADRPIRVTIFDTLGAAVGIYRVTAKAGDTLTIAEPIEGTVDDEIPAGYTAMGALTGGDIRDLQDAWDAMRAVILDQDDRIVALETENAALTARVLAIETFLDL
jgi:hypothetical protein